MTWKHLLAGLRRPYTPAVRTSDPNARGRLALETLENRRLLAATTLDTFQILEVSPILGEALVQWTGTADSASAQRAQQTATEDRDRDGDVDSEDLTTIVVHTPGDSAPQDPSAEAAQAADTIFAPADPEVTAYWLAGLDFYVGRKNFGPRYP